MNVMDGFTPIEEYKLYTCMECNHQFNSPKENTMSYKVLNFSHPMTKDARDKLAKMVGQDVQVFYIPVQVDFEKPIKPQVDQYVSYAIREHPFEAFIPPGLSILAAPMAARLRAILGTPPKFVVMKRETGLTPTFLPSEIMEW